MGQTKLKHLVLEEAQEDTKELRRYILKSVDVKTWKQMFTELAATFENIRQFLRAVIFRGAFRFRR